jgi:hypothetical protein
MTHPLKKKNRATFGPQGGYVPGYGAVPPTTYTAEIDLTNCKISNAGPTGVTVTGNPAYTYGNLTIPVSAGTSLSSPWTTTASINTARVRITDQDIELDGLSLKKTLKKLHERMAIMVPNTELEADFEQLRELRRQYEVLEQELQAKAETWNTLKNTDTK